MIDTSIEIRSTDKRWLVLALHHLIAKLESNNDLKGITGEHNYDLFYQMKEVEIS